MYDHRTQRYTCTNLMSYLGYWYCTAEEKTCRSHIFLQIQETFHIVKKCNGFWCSSLSFLKKKKTRERKSNITFLKEFNNIHLYQSSTFWGGGGLHCCALFYVNNNSTTRLMYKTNNQRF